MKLGYFHNGHFPPIEFEDFVRWGAANGYQVIDVPLFQPNARAICERHGLEPTSTTGMVCQPITADAATRAEAAAEARRALDYAAAEQIPIAWLGHQMAPDLGFDANVGLFAEGVAPVLDDAQRVGVRLVMENWADGGRNLAYAPAHWAAIFDAVPHEALGLCFDPSHLAWLGIDYLRAAREFGSRVYHAHAKDTVAGVNIGAPVAADDLDNDILTYSLGGSHASEFEIVATTGQLRTKSALDHETKPARRVTVRAEDPSGAAAAIIVTITVTDADDDGTASLSSTQPRVGTTLTARLIEPDGGVSGLTWTWERSPDQGLWTVIGGGASATYTPVADDLGQYLRATAFYSDTFGSGKIANAVSANPVQATAPPPPPPPPRGPSGPPAPPTPQGVIGATDSATAFELPGDRLLIQRHDVPDASLELAIGSISADGVTVVMAGVIRDTPLGQTYIVVRRESDGRIVRRWVPPYSPLVSQIPWPVVNTQYTVPVGVIGAIPLDDQFPEPNLLVRRFDGGDDRIFSYDADLQQWRHVPDIPTFQALGFYWCNVTAADDAFFGRIIEGPPYPASDRPARGDYPNCLTS